MEDKEFEITIKGIKKGRNPVDIIFILEHFKEALDTKKDIFEILNATIKKVNNGR